MSRELEAMLWLGAGLWIGYLLLGPKKAEAKMVDATTAKAQLEGELSRPCLCEDVIEGESYPCKCDESGRGTPIEGPLMASGRLY